MAKYSNLLGSQLSYLAVLGSFLMLVCIPLSGSCDTLTVHFLYGSKPAKGYKNTESKWFGGIHGGHVTIQIDNYVYGFNPSGKVHIFSHRKNHHSVFVRQEHSHWTSDTATHKYLSVKIPVDTSLSDSLKKIFEGWMQKVPYDYAFFGMRCASSAYYSLSKIGLMKKRNCFGSTVFNFYPKPFRRKLIKKSKSKNWQLISHPGRRSRKWEGD